MSDINTKTPVEADVHAKGLLSNLFNAFLDKLGQVLIGDFKLKDVELKNGQTPFNKDQLKRDSGGRDPILYAEYQAQEEEKSTWGNENNPDDNGYVDSKPTNQIVVLDKGKVAEESKDAPNFKIVYAPIASKGYEGYIVAIATYKLDGKPVEKQGFIKEKDFENWINERKEEWNIGEDVEPDMVNDTAEASTKMTVTLQKVTGSSSYDIDLIKINANYNLSQVSEDLNAILSDDTFVESIPEEETTYVVISDEDGSLDVSESEDAIKSTSDICQVLLNETNDLIDYLKVAKWGAKGMIRSEFMSTISSMQWSFDTIFDKLGEWFLADTGKVPQISHSNQMFDIDNLTAIELINDTISRIDKYLGNLDIVYVAFDSGRQTILEQMTESIRSTTDYALKRLTLQ